MSIASNFPAIKPTLLLDFANTEELDPRITFTRASTATYYGTQTAKAEENLVLQSQTFNNVSWANQNTTETDNAATAPDGTFTAATLNDGVATGGHDIANNFSGTSSTTYTLSAFFKNVDRQFVILACSASPSSWASAKFDLTAGTAGSTSASGAGWSTTSSSITSVGNSWYRCTITFVSGSTSTLAARLGMATDGTTFTASQRGLESYTGTNATIEIWGAQLEQRDAVTAYTPTTTQPITNYIPVLETAASGVARFDHNPTTFESLGLLIEESRTNLLTYSEQFDDAAWTKLNNNITANIITAPDGTLTGDQFIETTDSGTHRARSGAITVSASTSYTFTVYAKATATGAQRFLALTLSATTDLTTGARRTVVFDLSNGSSTTSGGTTFTLVGYGASSVGNGWYRCYTTVTTDAAGTTVYATSSLADSFSVSAISYTGDGTSGIYIWGAQLEAGAFPTSYIPTEASQVTRAADAASMTGTNFSSWYNAGEFTIYSEFRRDTTANAVAGGSPSVPRIYAFGTTSAGLFQLRLFGATGAEVLGPSLFMATSWAAAQNIKHAVVYKVNDAAVVKDGGAAVTDTTVDPFTTTVNTFSIGQNITGTGNIGQGWIRKLSYYPVRCTNAQLQGLTS